jgi:hypothetical protein
MRISWQRLAAVAGLAFVALYVVAFSLGIEVGHSDREILDYYEDSGNRAKEIGAFFCIAGAALSLLVFATAIRSLIARSERENAMLGALAWAGGIAGATLIFAGNALSRATALAAMDDDVFQLEPNTRRIFEAAGFLLFTSGTLAAILLVVATSLATLRHGLLPRWLGWAGFVVAVLLPLAIVFIGYLVFALWLIVVSLALAIRGPEPASSA